MVALSFGQDAADETGDRAPSAKRLFAVLIFGVLVILLLIFAPGGVSGLGRQIRDRLSRRRAS